jgi:uncharacterized protein YigE (DUF2233 family)
MKKFAAVFLWFVVTNCYAQSDSLGLFKKEIFQGKRYFVCEIDPTKYNIELYNILDKKNSLHSFYEIDSARKDLVLIVNGGMFMEDLRPQGLYVSYGKTYRKVNGVKEGYGNFYMQPNGIFLLDKRNKPQVVTTVKYLEEKINAVLATQSGPMLVVDSVFNSHFTRGSSNLNIRNGVGINKKGNVVLVTSEDLVNFYEFAELYRDRLACNNALYLDGAVSQYYAPSIHKEPRQVAMLGVFLVVSVK